MSKNTYIRQTGLTDVRKSRALSTRIGMALAGVGVAGTMLLGGFFGGHTGASSLQMERLANAGGTVSAYSYFARVNVTMLSYEVAQSSYRTIARHAAAHYGINPTLFERQINQESGFNPWALSSAGAEGIAQFMPATAASMGVNPWDPVSSLWGAARLMAQLNRQFRGNYAMALAAYNAGAGTVRSAINTGGNNWYGYLPSETRNYVRVIMGW